MYLFGTEHTGAHNLLRRLHIRPYAIFPTPDPDTLAVYFQDEEGPAIILVRYFRTWQWGWWRLQPPEEKQRRDWVAEEEERVVRFRHTGEALAQRLGCPVACALLITGPIRHNAAFSAFLQRARERGVTPVNQADVRRTMPLEWIRPEARAEHISLPPFPDQTRWRASIDPAWWQGRLSAVAVPDAQPRKQAAHALAWQALDFLKEAPARILVEGPAVTSATLSTSLAVPHEVLPGLPTYMDRPAGRRYLLWTGLYLAGACMADPAWEERSEAIVLGYLNFLLNQMEAWNNRERRVILRGLQMLAQKSVDHNLPQGTAIAQFFRDLFAHLMHDDFLAAPTSSWRWEWHLKELSETLARCGYISLSAWRQQWSRHKLRGEILNSVHGGLLDWLVWSADAETRKALASVEWELREKVKSRLGWHLYDNDFSPAFWDLVAQDDRLLADLAEAAVERQATPDFLPSDEALQRLVPLIQQRLQVPDLPSWIRSRLEGALPRLLPEKEGMKFSPSSEQMQHPCL